MEVMNSSKKLYILILNYNNWYDTIECVESVLKSTVNNYQIIILDNASPNSSELFIKKWLLGDLEVNISNVAIRNLIYPVSRKPLPFYYYRLDNNLLTRNIEEEEEAFKNWKIDNNNSISCYKPAHPIILIQNNKNYGFAGGNNVFLKTLIDSNEDANILLLNPDTVIKNNAIEELQKRNQISTHFVSGMSIYSYNEINRLISIGGSKLIKPIGNVVELKQYKTSKSIDYIYGAALFSNIATFKKIGLLPEEYFLYWEETDWCHIAKTNGIELRTCEKAVCFDKVGASIGRGYFSEYFFTFNSMLFYRKYYKKYYGSLLLFHLLRYFVKKIKNKDENASAIKHAVLDYIKRKKRRC